MNNSDLPRTPLAYITLVRHLAAIAEKAMDKIEGHPPIRLSELDRVAHNVETSAGLRGDSGIYESVRPDGIEVFQKEMYAIENGLRTRLLGLGYTYPTPRPLNETV